jgi:hypothetical protein
VISKYLYARCKRMRRSDHGQIQAQTHQTSERAEQPGRSARPYNLWTIQPRVNVSSAATIFFMYMTAGTKGVLPPGRAGEGWLRGAGGRLRRTPRAHTLSVTFLSRAVQAGSAPRRRHRLSPVPFPCLSMRGARRAAATGGLRASASGARALAGRLALWRRRGQAVAHGRGPPSRCGRGARNRG